MTPLELHVQRWSGGCGSCECPKANRVVLFRGRVPCDVLFLGEAPGESENVLGRPFKGPAGKLLDSIVERAIGERSARVAFTNLVGCIPRESDGDKSTEPSDEQIESCKPRLVEFVRLANPRLIVCVGALARDWTEPGLKHSVKFHREIPCVSITHPAAILRANVASRSLMVQRCVVAVRNAVGELR